MKRRVFGLMAGCSMVALMGPKTRAFADSPDPNSLDGPTLTPMGSERAGNAAGTIPAWTGGMTEIPASSGWDPTKTLPPDFFASDPMLYEVNSSNMAQYAALLSDGIQTLIKNQGFYLKVYPTHRTHALPQWVYDNIKLNVTRSTVQDGQARLGFNGGYGGYPFPILSSDPAEAGAMAIWNHEAHWFGPYLTQTTCEYVVASPGSPPVLSTAGHLNYRCDFYQQGKSPAETGYHFSTVYLNEFGPPTSAGEEAIGNIATNPAVHPQSTWALLPGQGRVRKTPNEQFDTPSQYTDGITNFDETNGFYGPEYKYDWKLVGKQEMLIPYNNNKLFTANGRAMHMPKWYDPEYIRWELHRCWVVEAVLHPGERNVSARRKMYIDEDDWTIHVADTWDSAGNIYHLTYLMNAVFPNLPGAIYANAVLYDLQTGQYCTIGGSYGDAPFNAPWSFDPVPDDVFNPQAMAAQSSY
jgi:hypothetical protein